MEILVSFVSGSFFSGVILFVLRSNLESRRIFLERTERVVLALNKFQRAIMGDYIAFSGAMSGRYGYNEALDIQIKIGAPDSDEIHYFGSLFQFYFPEMEGDYTKLMAARDRLYAIQKDYRDFFNVTGGPNTKHAEEYHSAIDEFNMCADRLMKGIRGQARAAQKQIWYH